MVRRCISVSAHGRGLAALAVAAARGHAAPVAGASDAAGHVPADRRQFGRTRRGSRADRSRRGASFEAHRARRVHRSVGRAGRPDRTGRAVRASPRAARRAARPARRAQCRGVLRLPTGFALVQRAAEPRPAASMRGGEILAVAAVGSVRATISVDGFSEANTALQQHRQARGLEPEPAADLRPAAAVGRQREVGAGRGGSAPSSRRRARSSPRTTSWKRTSRSASCMPTTAR